MFPFQVRNSIFRAVITAALAVFADALGVLDSPAVPRAFAADDAIAASAPLTLGSILHDLSESNPTLAAKRAMTSAAEERHRSTGAWESPMLEFGVVNVPTSWDFNEDEMTMKMVGVAQRIPLFGAKKYQGRAAGRRRTRQAPHRRAPISSSSGERSKRTPTPTTRWRGRARQHGTNR